MKYSRVFAVAAAAVLSFTSVVATSCDKKPKHQAEPDQAGAPVQDSGNAAPVYLALYDKIGKPFLSSLSETVSRGGVPDPASLKSHKADIDELIAATRLPECDFGIKLDSFEAPVPHLVPMRALVKLLDADAKRSLSENNPVAAAARAAAILRISRHLSLRSQTLIEGLVAASTAGLGLKLVNDRIDPATLPDQLRTELREVLAALDTPDLLNGQRTIISDLENSARAFRENKVPKDGEGRALSQADQQRAATEVEAAAKKVPTAWNSTDPKAALAALGSGASPGASSIIGVLPNVWRSISEVKGSLSAAKKKLNG